MAKRKRKSVGSLHEHILKVGEELRALPIEGTRWFVVDFYPMRRAPWHDEYNDWLDSKAVVASEYFDTEEEAEQWASEYEPEEGAELKIYKENLRVFTERRWVNY